MEFIIRKINKSDKSEIISMMKEFYSSPAVLTNGSLEIFQTDFDACLDKNNPFLEGYIFESEKIVIGYAMLAKSFSTEFGKNCIWLEDLFIKSEYRGNGIIPKFLNFVKQQYPNTIFKLEVEKENTHAVHVYQKCGFKFLEYFEMQRD